MSGRAGRAGIDEGGELFLVSHPTDWEQQGRVEQLLRTGGGAEPVASGLKGSPAGESWGAGRGACSGPTASDLRPAAALHCAAAPLRLWAPGWS
jgi:hypothetical protein